MSEEKEVGEKCLEGETLYSAYRTPREYSSSSTEEEDTKGEVYPPVEKLSISEPEEQTETTIREQEEKKVESPSLAEIMKMIQSLGQQMNQQREELKQSINQKLDQTTQRIEQKIEAKTQELSQEIKDTKLELNKLKQELTEQSKTFDKKIEDTKAELKSVIEDNNQLVKKDINRIQNEVKADFTHINMNFSKIDQKIEHVELECNKEIVSIKEKVESNDKRYIKCSDTLNKIQEENADQREVMQRIEKKLSLGTAMPSSSVILGSADTLPKFHGKQYENPIAFIRTVKGLLQNNSDETNKLAAHFGENVTEVVMSYEVLLEQHSTTKEHRVLKFQYNFMEYKRVRKKL